MASPTPKKNITKLLTFSQAIDEIKDGKRVTKLEWADNTIYGMLKDGFLMINMGELKRWILSDGDLMGEDYIVLPDLN